MSSVEVCRLTWHAIPADNELNSTVARAPALLYSLGMPHQTITVRRPRRSLFAVPRALPDWLRSVWAVLSRTPASDVDIAELDSIELHHTNVPAFPQLAIDASGAHRCVGCELCVRVCPSRCLTLAAEGQSTGIRVTQFDLERGACIGCGICGEACPEDAIEMSRGLRVELAPLSGRSGVTDLLAMRG
jgi:formate hydrogenlyase subunit 6/NADH:ubiquinone oxidoreductase subunit I